MCELDWNVSEKEVEGTSAVTKPGTNDAVAVGCIEGVGGITVAAGVGATDRVPVAVFDWPLAATTRIRISAANSAGEESVRGDMLARGGSAAARRRRGSGAAGRRRERK